MDECGLQENLERKLARGLPDWNPARKLIEAYRQLPLQLVAQGLLLISEAGKRKGEGDSKNKLCALSY